MPGDCRPEGLRYRRRLRTGAIEEELERVELTAVDEDFVVQVIAGCAARGTGVPDDIAAADQIAGVDTAAVEMRVACRDPEAVADHPHVAVGARSRRSFDG